MRARRFHGPRFFLRVVMVSPILDDHPDAHEPSGEIHVGLWLGVEEAGVRRQIRSWTIKDDVGACRGAPRTDFAARRGFGIAQIPFGAHWGNDRRPVATPEPAGHRVATHRLQSTPSARALAAAFGQG